MKTVFILALMQLKRVFRDPITLLVLFAIPTVLLLMIGALTTRGEDNLSLQIAVINHSDEEFAKTFGESLKKVKVFKQSDEKLTLDQAKEKMRADQLDGIIELPKDFGRLSEGVPSGKVKVYFDETETAGDIVSGVINGVVEQTNQQITGSKPPIEVERTPLSGAGARIFDGIFAMFTAMAIMMVGIFGVASAIPYDKKSGILRRLRVTPLKTTQFIIGMILAYMVVGVLAVIVMTGIAIGLFDLTMKGSWIDFALFSMLAISLMIGLGLMVGGWAKNTTQSDIYGQVIFLGSMAASGLWFPRALMPEWVQTVTAFLPLTSVIEGIRSIVAEGVVFVALGQELLIIAAWVVVVVFVGVKTFRWE